MPSYRTIVLQLGHPANSHIATIRLARPQKKNAITYQMYTEIGRALDEVSLHSDTKAVILTASGDYYSSGNDLANFSQLMHPKKMAAQAKIVCYEFVDKFIECKKPIVVAANGPGIGIAVTTMGLCDRRISVPGATFHTPFRALGQAPEGCSSLTFPRLMGDEFAKEVLDNGRKFDAAEGRKRGFFHDVSKQNDTLMSEAMAAALELCETSRDIRGNIVRWYESEPGLKHELKNVNQKEVDVLEHAWVSRECFEALSAYLSSRKQTVPAAVLRGLNATRFIWDR